MRGLKEGIVELKKRTEKTFVKIPRETCIAVIIEMVKKEIEKKPL
jgi:hypothetical protein